MQRRLTAVEEFMCRNAARIPINFAMCVRVAGVVERTALQAALRHMQRRHPLLGVRVEERPDGAYFTRADVPELPLRVVGDARPDAWMAEASRELTAPFDWRRGPLARLVWLPRAAESELLLVSHHAIGDGYSAVNFFRDLLAALADPAAPPPPLDPLPDLGALFPVSSPMRAAALGFRGLLRLKALGRLGRAPRAIMAPGSMRHHLHPRALGADDSARLVARAQREGTSVHAALGVAFMRAFGELDVGASRRRWQRRISSPVSLRRHANRAVDDDFGLFIVLRETAANCAPERDFWQVARELKADLAKQTTRAKLATEAHVVGTLTARELRGVDFFAKHYDLSITNLGRIRLPEQVGPLRVADVYGPIVCAAEQENVVGVQWQGDRIRFLLVSDQATLGPERADAILDRALAQLQAASA